MWFEDLSPCTYLDDDNPGKFVAVGWLEHGKPYATGTVERRVFAALARIRSRPLHSVSHRGWHECDLCQSRASPRGNAVLLIPGKREVFACPSLITHYIESHGYAPPEVFCQAVLACPSGWLRYLWAFVNRGGTISPLG